MLNPPLQVGEVVYLRCVVSCLWADGERGPGCHLAVLDEGGERHGHVMVMDAPRGAMVPEPGWLVRPKKRLMAERGAKR